MDWRKPTHENIEEALAQIENTPLIYGTHWEPPLEFALGMNPKPDIIVFMTDGSSGKESLKIAKDVADSARRKRIVINTVALMEPKAVEGMKVLAEETGGSATMVKNENEIVDLLTGDVRSE